MKRRPMTPDEIAALQDRTGVGRDAPIDLSVLLGKAKAEPPLKYAPRYIKRREYYEIP